MCCVTSEMVGGSWKVPGGKWVSSDPFSQYVKYSPKSKRGKPAGRREEVEKFQSFGIDVLERAFNGGFDRPDHAQLSGCSCTGCWYATRKQLAIHNRVIGSGYNQRFARFLEDKSKQRRRAAKRDVRAGLLDAEDDE